MNCNVALIMTSFTVYVVVVREFCAASYASKVCSELQFKLLGANKVVI
jgi:hypothetical protein